MRRRGKVVVVGGEGGLSPFWSARHKLGDVREPAYISAGTSASVQYPRRLSPQTTRIILLLSTGCRRSKKTDYRGEKNDCAQLPIG